MTNYLAYHIFYQIWATYSVFTIQGRRKTVDLEFFGTTCLTVFEHPDRSHSWHFLPLPKQLNLIICILTNILLSHASRYVKNKHEKYKFTIMMAG